MKSIFVLILILTFKVQAAPLELVVGAFDSGKLFISCNFDGSEQNCFIDTGSPSTFIKKNKFSIVYRSQGQVDSGGASGIITRCDLVKIDHFSVLEDIKIKNILVKRCPSEKDASVNDSVNHSIIGLNIFEAKNIFFNFTEGTLSEVDEIPSSLKKSVIQNEVRGHISISMKSNDTDVFGIWDTGAGLTSVDEKFVEKYPANFIYIQDIIGFDSNNVQMSMKLYKAKKIQIGNIKYKDQYVLGFDFITLRPYINENVQFIIGYNIITKSNWFFDMNKNEWAITQK